MDDEWYFATGADENFGRTDTVYRYNIDADTYTSPLATCPFDVSGVKHGVIGGEMYLAGGNQVGADDNFAKYNPATNVWTTLTDAPKIATSACADEAAGRFWIINTGGQLAYYDVALGTWNDGPFAIPPLTMVVPIMACYDGKLYVLSGTGGEDSTQIYDIAGDSWTHLTTAPHVWPGSTYTGHRAYVVDGRFIYTAGGFDGSDLRDEVYRYAMGD
jgi:N-acetylneuraminic acid mutarotase